MPNMPAFCDTCGTAFNSGIFVENVTSLTMRGNKSGPCPKCGGTGSIPDGTFNVIGHAIEIISAPKSTVDQLKKLANILSVAKKEDADTTKIAQRIEKELPELSSLKGLLPKTRTELYAFIALLLTAITLVVNIKNASPKASVNTHNIVNQSIQIIVGRQ
jgi:hypothetical protein